MCFFSVLSSGITLISIFNTVFFFLFFEYNILYSLTNLPHVCHVGLFLLSSCIFQCRGEHRLKGNLPEDIFQKRQRQKPEELYGWFMKN